MLAEMTFRDFWDDRVQHDPDAPFLHYDGCTWSYGDFDRSINRLANGLAGEGVAAGTKVAMFIDNSFELLRLQWALQKLAAVWVPIIPSSTEAEARYVLDHSQADVLLAGASQWERISARHAGARAFVLDAENQFGALDTEEESPPPPTGAGPYDPMALMYTSGSTGKPKGVLQPNCGFRTIGQAYVDRIGITPDDVWHCTLPLFHSAATHLLLAPTMAAGCSILFCPRFSRTSFWEDARRYNATLTLLFPAQMSMLMTNPESAGDREHSIRFSLSHITNKTFTDRFGVEILTSCSQTESMGLGVMTPPGFTEGERGLVGPALPDDLQLKIVGPDDATLPAGERGEICFQHPHMMLGYYNDPENTAKTLKGGWLHTGDIGSIDDRGWVTYHGRVKNMIKRQGENIAGEEVEFALMQHPAVEEAVVCGVADPIRTEEVYAIVHPREGRSVDPADLIETVPAELSAWKLPRYVVVHEPEFPRLPNGKLNRLALTRDVVTEGVWDRESQQVTAG